jgi:uncharacterized membrane protein YuzA (DUF378 family)
MPGEKLSYMKALDVVAAALVFIGGVNWGLVGLFDFNLVNFIFGGLPALVRIIYILVGIAAVYDLALWRAIQRRWECTGFYGRAVRA